MTKKLFVLIGCDTDPVVGPDQQGIFSKENVWNDTIRSVIKLKEEIEIFEDLKGNSPKITWYLRSDQQINMIWGDWCYPVREYASTWNEFEKSGDEIGWHPHLWRLNVMRKIWYQEINDDDWIYHCLENGYHAISKIFRIKSVRMGWDFHNNNTMNQLQSFGVHYDLSAIPGIKNSGVDNNIFDWENAPKFPYFPSKNDYKREESNRSNNLEVMEIPISTYSIPFYLRVLTRKKIMAANIAKHPLFFRNTFKTIFKNNYEDSFLSMYFHPSDINEEKKLFSLRNFKRNLKNILNVSKKKKFEVWFITPQDFRRYDAVDLDGF